MSLTEDLLIEIGTEELPPRSIAGLARAFKEAVIAELAGQRLSHAGIKWYATPRRLALIVSALSSRQQDKKCQRRGPNLKTAYDQGGRPTQAALGFARSCAVDIHQLEKLETDQGAWLVYNTLEKGQETAGLLPNLIEKTLKRLPIPTRMQWGQSPLEFVRPVHWLILLFGDHPIDFTLFGRRADRFTYGHRFHHAQPIPINHANEYLEKLEKIGFVQADFQGRLEYIASEIKRIAAEEKGTALVDHALLEEITGLTEWPVALTGKFDPRFLSLPKEVLIATMRDQQKYIPITCNNQLLPVFIIVSNIASTKSELIVHGNERVIRSRFSDALFFYRRDCAGTLSSHIDALRHVVYQEKIGSLYDKSQRIRALAVYLAETLNSSPVHADRAAELSKCDLLTEMVNEFPKLQGVIGRYYAIHDHEHAAVATAIDEQYMPRFSGDQLPKTEAGQILAIADKMDTLAGIFSLNQSPDGEKDPFALRRAALGVLRIMIECSLDINLSKLIEVAVSAFKDTVNTANIDS